jgi:protease IV
VNILNRLVAWWRRPRFNVDAVATGGAPDPLAVMTAMVKDMLIDRRSERRSKAWRVAFFALIFITPVIFYSVVYSYAAGFRFGPKVDVVGVVHIDGEISADSAASAERINASLKTAFESQHVKAVVLSIDSPGGAPVEAERIYGAIKQLRAANPKPVVAVINNIGASAAYMVALHADRIVAARYSLVGSVGAIMQGWDFHKAMERFDVAARVYASGDLKSMLNPYTAMSAAADNKAKDLVAKMGQQFRSELDVQRKGKLKPGIDYSSGEVWGGIEAKDVGLIDELGTIDDVVKGFANAKAHDFGPSARTVPFLSTAGDWLRGVMIGALGQQEFRLR